MLLSPERPTDSSKECDRKRNRKGQGLKDAFRSCNKFESWVYMVGGKYLNTGGVHWEFWVEVKSQEWDWECVDSAIKVAGGPDTVSHY